MGGFTSAVAPLLHVSSNISPFVSIASQALKTGNNADGIKQQNNLSEQQLAAKLEQQRQERLLQLAQDNQSRTQNLSKALARQKALFAAQGVDRGTGGSADTVLQSIIDTSETEAKNAAQIEALRQKADELALSQLQSKNLLDLSIARRKGDVSLMTGLLA